MQAARPAALFGLLALSAVAALALLATAAPAASAAPAAAPAQDIERAMEALKYLQELDRYYSQVARPRFGKRTEARPFSDDSLEEASNEKLWRRFSRRR
ncbi:hypothetical protein R5R35_002082 [Gryllus longicercus]|uniref:Neuropeptide F n=1 Tax=Gryllus longicercus TaxID=2509291 RepID=A0AAN9YTU9_9ORTH